MAKESRLTWMVVEDDHAIREIIQIMCELWQYELLAFKDGWEAMAYLNKPETPEPLPEIALLDIRMPGPWGHEISARIRKHDTLKDIGIILMTAYDLPGSEEADYLKSSGADKLIYKPLPPMDVLLETVREVIARRASDRIAASEAATKTSPTAETPAPPAAPDLKPAVPLLPKTPLEPVSQKPVPQTTATTPAKSTTEAAPETTTTAKTPAKPAAEPTSAPPAAAAATSANEKLPSPVSATPEPVPTKPTASTQPDSETSAPLTAAEDAAPSGGKPSPAQDIQPEKKPDPSPAAEKTVTPGASSGTEK